MQVSSYVWSVHFFFVHKQVKLEIGKLTRRELVLFCIRVLNVFPLYGFQKSWVGILNRDFMSCGLLCNWKKRNFVFKADVPHVSIVTRAFTYTEVSISLSFNFFFSCFDLKVISCSIYWTIFWVSQGTTLKRTFI